MMAKIVDDIAGLHGGRIYPWRLWLDGQARLLSEGVDFALQVDSFRVQVYQAAFRAGKTVHTRVDGPDIYVQADPPPYPVVRSPGGRGGQGTRHMALSSEDGDDGWPEIDRGWVKDD